MDQRLTFPNAPASLKKVPARRVGCRVGMDHDGVMQSFDLSRLLLLDRLSSLLLQHFHMLSLGGQFSSARNSVYALTRMRRFQPDLFDLELELSDS